ncbi:MAG: MFS transporter [Acetobacteraceae bacterium]|nr:MFS transporter [Acetobacteraceae bacterium]
MAVPILALTLGHVFSNAVRTLPAVAADVLAADLGLSAEGLAAVTAVFPASFALAMIPTGVALDRYGVRRTALALLAVGALGAVLAALAGGTGGMLLAQAVLGIGCSGMLMCPVTFAGRALPLPRFALWSGVIQAVGNTGMLLSASPLALLVEWRGWQAGFWASAALALLAWTAVALAVPEPAPTRAAARRTVWQDARQVGALARSPALRPLMVFALASFAAVLGVRGLWGGPWLMEAKGLGRVEAGNLLLLCTAALTLGPALAGVADRLLGYRDALMAGSHALVALIILLMAAGGPGGPLAAAFGLPVLPPGFDAVLLVCFGLVISFQVLIFPAARALVPPEQTGRALSAVNTSFFGGAAVMQAVSGVAASTAGIGAALCSFAAALLLCSAGFLLLRRQAAPHPVAAR